MNKRKSKAQWMILAKEYNSSGLNLTAWEPSEQKWAQSL